MTDYMKMYLASDDSVVSVSGLTNPVEFELRADLEESKSQRLYMKAEAGFEVGNASEPAEEGVTITPTGTTYLKWQLALETVAEEEPGSYGAAGAELFLGLVTTTNKYFWAKASATDDEEPSTDTTVTLDAEGIAKAV